MADEVELKKLRAENAELRMERDVFKRSVVLWVLLLLHTGPADLVFRLPGPPYATSYDVALDTSDERPAQDPARQGLAAGTDLAVGGRSAVLLRAVRAS